jgi:hypothetical protein
MGGLEVVMDMYKTLEGAGTRRGRERRVAYEDEDHVYTLCIAVELSRRSNDSLIRRPRRRDCFLPSKGGKFSTYSSPCLFLAETMRKLFIT